MASLKQEVFMKQVERLIDLWVKDMGDAILKYEEILVEIANLELKEPLSADDKKQIEKLKKDLDAAVKKVEGIRDGLKVSMMGITDPIEAEPQDLTKNLPTRIKEIVKKKGMPISKKVTLTPDVGFDVKSKRIKSFSVGLKW
jgi:hypothetical protein